jgi:adenylate kinase
VPHEQEVTDKRFFLFGLSGAGKTRASVAYVARHPDVAYVNAGALLQQAAGRADDRAVLQDAATVLANQRLLPKLLEDRLAKCQSAAVLIDAHLLIDTGKEVVQVPMDVIASMHPSVFVLLEAPPTEILRRRLLRGRPSVDRTTEQLAAQQRQSREVLTDYSRRLRVPLRVVESTDGTELDGVLDAAGS